jgi:hypothetical protein
MRHIRTLTFGLLLVLFLAQAGFAQGGKVVQGKYFDVYYDGCDLTEVAQKLAAKYFLHIDVFSENSSSSNIQSIIAQLFDSIYLEVSDILDIHMYSFKGVICIMPNKADVKDLLAEYMTDPPDVPAFYFHERNTVYVSLADMNLGILSHEIAHAIIARYFVVLPPAKVQEVLAGYVEYSIRKATGTMPLGR